MKVGFRCNRERGRYFGCTSFLQVNCLKVPYPDSNPALPDAGYIWDGVVEKSGEWLDKAVAYRDSGVATFPIVPLLANLHDDPRWLPFLESIGRSPTQLAAIEFEVELPQ